VNKYPRLRTHVRKGANGQRWVSYWYDNRPHGPDTPLGSDYAKALEGWERLHNHLPLTVGKIQQAIDRYKDDILPNLRKGTRQQYTTYLKSIEPVFGSATWEDVNLPALRRYLDTRTKKVSANRELAVLSVIWQKAILWGITEKQWPAVGVKDWKNAEAPRNVEVTDALFNAIYQQADRLLKDSMDIATATGMRITDVRSIMMPTNGVLRFKASKTGKWAEFSVIDSPVLTAIVKRREAMKAHCVMLLCTDTGRQATERMLLNRFNIAKGKAAKAQPELAADLATLLNRDMRSRAADLSDDLESAAKLLQHSNKKTTERHYRNKPEILRAVR
jgi:hypothetical protein